MDQKTKDLFSQLSKLFPDIKLTKYVSFWKNYSFRSYCYFYRSCYYSYRSYHFLVIIFIVLIIFFYSWSITYFLSSVSGNIISMLDFFSSHAKILMSVDEYDTIWYDTIWNDMIWNDDMIWYDMTRYEDMKWYDLV
jgi:hypothetical protein